MSGLTGWGVTEPNIFFRFFAIIFLGVVGLGVVLSWRGSLLLASEYQDMPISHKTREIRQKNELKQKEMLARELKK